MFNNKKGYIIKLRNSRSFKGFTVMIILNFIFHIIQPNVSLALTEGHSQPEVQSFEPVSTNQMVDLFTGDFNYNIPLFNLPGANGGYPFNLAYHAGESMDDEASMVGLGWNINPGSLVRNMRGLPDEFKSEVDDAGNWTGKDFLQTKLDMKSNITVGVKGIKKYEIFGGKLPEAASLSLSIKYNNYRGWGASVSQGYEGISGKTPYSLGYSLDLDNGVGVTASASCEKYHSKIISRHQFGVSFDGNLSLNYSLSIEKDAKHESSGETVSHKYNRGSNQISFARQNTFNPSIGRNVNNYGISFDFIKGKEIAGVFSSKGFGLFVNWEDFNNEEKKGNRKVPVIGYQREGVKTGEILKESRFAYTKDYQRQNEGTIYPESAVLASSYYAYDAYNFTGQGNSGYFRAKRNDIGRVHDASKRNNSSSVGVGIDLSSSWLQGGITTELVPDGVGGFCQNILVIPDQMIGKKIGVDGTIGYGYNQQGPWGTNSGDLNELDYDFLDPNPAGINENMFYKMNGEQTILDDHEFDRLGGLGKVVVKFQDKTEDHLIGERRIRVADNTDLKNSRSMNDDLERVVRNTLVHSLKNKEVSKLGDFAIKHYNFSTSLNLRNDPTVNLNRSYRNVSVEGESIDVSIDEHNAGYKVLNEDGSYYVYALPAYNIKEVENIYSVKADQLDNTNASNALFANVKIKDGEVDYKRYLRGNQYINKTTKSPYAHAFMLSSVQGADYVDRTNNGPSDDDLGYWVKFDYINYTGTENYKWRSPYRSDKGQFNRGAAYTKDDDMASYQYGEKELWYIGRVETNTHIAIFEFDERLDNKASENEIEETQGVISDNKAGLRLKSIKIYDKKSFKNNPNAVPLQVIHFETDYSLCPNTPNSVAPGGGKLTLKSIWFENNGSTKGMYNKYKFDYSKPNNTEDPELNDLVNPSYKNAAYDSWGTYRNWVDSRFGAQVNFPYVNQCVSQSSQGVDANEIPIWRQTWMQNYYDNDRLETKLNKKKTKEAQDLLASSWCLRSIKLPSGGTINVDYESDDYAYVQHKTANQMFKIEKLGDAPDQQSDELYNDGETDFSNGLSRRIYFNLEDPIAINAINPYKKVYNRYINPIIKDENGDRNLYFKSRVKLTAETYDYVSGYLTLEEMSNVNYGVENVRTIDGVECYTRGFVTVKQMKKPNGENFNYHPMSLFAWNYLQIEAPELLNNGNSFDSEDINAQNVLGHLVDIINVVPNILSQFGGNRKYCKLANYGRFIDLENSCIRLASPDKVKYGGGHRVREISMTDNWGSDVPEENSRTYGQHYDYTIKENGMEKPISSGVTQYEPQLGGDENALKYPIYYQGKQSFYTSNNLFTEAPLNEDLFPGASVGYRSVKVTSLNTNQQMKKAINELPGIPIGGTTGVTIHEFYTAKEFPTIVDYSTLKEENNTKSVFHVPIPIPLIGGLSRNYYSGSQAFSIELNDMHGKIKSVSSYELSGYVMKSEAISSTTYEYLASPMVKDDEAVFRLISNVPIIKNDNSHEILKESGTTVIDTKRLGVDVDLYTDQRESKSFNSSIGIQLNFDFPIIPPPPTPPIPIPSVWPSIQNHKTVFRTYVTNKVIQRTGILIRTISKDIQATNDVKFIAFDEKSGHPILTKVINEFGHAFYNYDIPAYYHYDRMGHAYRNINYTFTTSIVQSPNDRQFIYFAPTTENIDNLVRGDELLAIDCSDNHGINRKGYFLGWKYEGNNVKGIINFPDTDVLQDDGGTPITGEITLKVIRSGRRNNHTIMAASYQSKGLITSTSLTDVNLTSPSEVDGSVIKTKAITSKNVLSATAGLFKDDWGIEVDNNNINVLNPFLTGNSGIWRPYKSYTYVGKRKSSASNTDNSTTNPNLKEDGVFSDIVLPMFSWELGNMEDYVSNWEWVNEITKFNKNAYELENINRLGIYSSALYGYNNSLSIAVGGNSTYNELGAMDFETSEAIWNAGKSMKETNINVYNTVSPVANLFLSKSISIKKSKKLENGNLEIYLTNPSIEIQNLFASNHPNNFGISLNSIKNNSQSGNLSTFVNGNYVSHSIINSSGGNPIMIKLVVIPFANHLTSNPLIENGEYSGKLTMLIEKVFHATDNASSVAFVNTKAHTGKKSMKISQITIFDQPNIDVISNKNYVVSAWISRDNIKVKSFESTSGDIIVPGYIGSGGFVVAQNYKIKYGKIVEGWQKIDIEFKAVPTFGSFALKFNNSENNLYVDDLRFSPKTGGITTYVYDLMNFRLKASLNIDNYATLFFYDEQGNLTLKKEETEEGIFTITQSKANVSKSVE